MSGVLYSLSFPNGKQYIGITVQSLAKRLACHRRSVKAGKRRLLFNAWRKHGEPVASVLAHLEPDMLRMTETRAIAVFKTMSPYGYNMTPGGEGMVCDALRQKMSDAGKGRPKSEEHRRKISEGQKGRAGVWSKDKRPFSSQHIARLLRVGWNHTDESKAKMSARIKQAWARRKGVT